jgi:hypothetical protein
MNVGVYVAAGPNPIFLRMLMLQVARQTKLPEYIAIYENGNKTPAFHWACKEIREQLESKGVKVLYRHDPEPCNRVKRYFEPLRMLVYETETDIFLKMDLDDFYADQYIENTSGMLGDNDWSINLNSSLVLVRPFKGDFKYKDSAVMHHSPVGAAPTHVSFNRHFAGQYMGTLAGALTREDTADDDLMAETLKGMKVLRVEGPVDYTYVSHGTNESSSGWQSTGGKIYFDN